MLTTESVQLFLETSTLPDLAELYDSGMEVQVNVAKDNGEPVEGKKKVYRDQDGQEWRSFRIPYSADTDPHYDDKPLMFDMGAHAEAVGLSGWNWKKQVSQWVGFDFDAIVGHAPTHGKKLSAELLNSIREKLEGLDYVTVRASTGGHGLHVYVFLDNVPTKNHCEHAALARAILDRMTLDSGCDLRSTVDVCGAILWFWHRKLNIANGGLKLLKKGGILKDVPLNWRDHVAAVTGKKSKAKPAFISDVKAEELFDTLSSHRHKVQLDDDHKALIRFLKDEAMVCEYSVEHNMLVTHTVGFAKAHEKLQFKGVFKTMSSGEDMFDQNCFAFPMRDGAWVIRRFTRGTQEADTWERDDKGWTRCYFNKSPNFRLACIAKQGIELKEGGFQFRFVHTIIEVLATLGLTLEIPDAYRQREGIVKEQKDGRLVVTMNYVTNDNMADLSSWLLKKDKWERVVQKPFASYEESDSVDHDNVVRCLVSAGTEVGWSLNTSGSWVMRPPSSIQMYLKSIGMDGAEVTRVMGSSVSKYWSMVNKPFQTEYPGDRQWNRDCAQLSVTPSLNADNLNYPHWSKILKHLGRGLDLVLKNDTWAQLNNVTSGEDYLRLWIASVIKYPNQPLPYLFFYGQEDCGKSVFCESLELIIQNGIMKADNALMNQAGHNGELANSVICYIEETDLSKNKVILNRLKDYVTANNILLHVKYLTPCMVPNTTHWVQFGNHMDYCPAFPGDSRIVVLQVGPLDPLEMIPKRQLMEALQNEAADFLRSILDLEIPPTPSRLNIPVIKTAEKESLMEANKSSLQLFLDEHCHNIPGCMVSLDALYNKFLVSVEASERGKWKKTEIWKNLPPCYLSGKNTADAGKRWIIDMSFDPMEEPKERKIIVDQFIRPLGYMGKVGDE